MTDTRTMMYRMKDGEVESHIFASPEEVPPGEGWEDNPAKCQEAPKKRGRKPKDPESSATEEELNLDDDNA